MDPLAGGWLAPAFVAVNATAVFGLLTERDALALAAAVTAIGGASIALYQRWRQTRRAEEAEDEKQFAASRQAHIDQLESKVAELETALKEATTQRDEIKARLVSLETRIDKIICPFLIKGQARCYGESAPLDMSDEERAMFAPHRDES